MPLKIHCSSHNHPAAIASVNAVTGAPTRACSFHEICTFHIRSPGSHRSGVSGRKLSSCPTPQRAFRCRFHRYRNEVRAGRRFLFERQAPSFSEDGGKVSPRPRAQSSEFPTCAVGSIELMTWKFLLPSSDEIMSFRPDILSNMRSIPISSSISSAAPSAVIPARLRVPASNRRASAFNFSSRFFSWRL